MDEGTKGFIMFLGMCAIIILGMAVVFYGHYIEQLRRTEVCEPFDMYPSTPLNVDYEYYDTCENLTHKIVIYEDKVFIETIRDYEELR